MGKVMSAPARCYVWCTAMGKVIIKLRGVECRFYYRAGVRRDVVQLHI